MPQFLNLDPHRSILKIQCVCGQFWLLAGNVVNDGHDTCKAWSLSFAMQPQVQGYAQARFHTNSLRHQLTEDDKNYFISVLARAFFGVCMDYCDWRCICGCT